MASDAFIGALAGKVIVIVGHVAVLAVPRPWVQRLRVRMSSSPRAM